MGDFTWTIEGNKLVCLAVSGREKLDLTVKSIVDGKMEVEGDYQRLDANGNVSNVINTATGTLIKTVITQSPTLTESLMAGDWTLAVDDATNNIVISSDHTFMFTPSYISGTWGIEGSRFIGVIPDGHIDGTDWDFSFTVESMETAATTIVLNLVEGIDGGHPFVGTLTKNI